MSNTKLKPLYLLDIFREKTDSRHRLTVPELLEELERRGVCAERKGIYRDIEALKQYGAAIKCTGSGYYLAKGELSEYELKCIAWALCSAGFLSERRTEALMDKLKKLIGMRINTIAMPPYAASKAPDDQLMENIDKLGNAIEQRRQVTYGNKNAPEGSRRPRISPYALLWLERGCCVLCNIEGQDGLSCIDVADIGSIRADMTPWRHYSEISCCRELDTAAIIKRLEAGEDIRSPRGETTGGNR